jgi:hypothetical protein
MDKDWDVPCAVLGKKPSRKGWNLSDFIIYTTNKPVAWRSAASIEAQQARLNDKMECIVVLRDDFDRGKFDPVKPPKDFDLKLREGPLEESPRMVIKPQPPKAVRLEEAEPKSKPAPAVVVSPTPKKLNPMFEMVESKAAPVETPVATPKLSGYQPKLCPYCSGEVPSNGAAQFSHLKKHINELVGRSVLTKEQADGIRSIKLTPEMAQIFAGAFPNAKVS